MPAVTWKGTHASNAVSITRGSLGIAVIHDEAATVGTLNIGYVDSQDTDAQVIIGKGTTLGTVTKNGGVLTIMEAAAAITSFTQYAGTTHLDGTYGVTALVVRGGTLYYNTTGTLAGNPIVSGAGVLDFSHDPQVKTVTNPIEVYGDEAQVNDPSKVVSSLVIDFNETTRLGNLGRNVRVTRGTPA
jgi:hypothetical protein